MVYFQNDLASRGRGTKRKNRRQRQTTCVCVSLSRRLAAAAVVAAVVVVAIGLHHDSGTGVAELFPLEDGSQGGIQLDGLFDQGQALEAIAPFHFKQGKGLQDLGRTGARVLAVAHNGDAHKVQKDGPDALAGSPRPLQVQGQEQGGHGQLGMVARLSVVVLLNFGNDASVNGFGLVGFAVLDFAQGKVVLLGQDDVVWWIIVGGGQRGLVSVVVVGQ